MTAANFGRCFQLTETKWEGWHQFSNDPIDPGGATWCGLTQNAYDGWRARQGLPKRFVKNATDDEIKTIFHDEYWAAVRGDDLFLGLDYEIYDIAINSGPRTAIKFLQQSLHISVDGWFGLETLNAVNKCADRRGLINTIYDKRMSYWHSLTTWWRFGKGWAARGEGTAQIALQMLAGG